MDAFRAKSSPNTLPQLLASKASEWKHAKDLIVFGPIEDGRWTFGEFSKMVSGHACGLLDARIRPHDTIAFDLDDFQLENIVSFYASAMAGLHVAHVDGTPTGPFLAKSVARGAIVNRENVDNYYAAVEHLEGHAYGSEFRFPEFPALKTLIQTGRDPIPAFISYEGVSVGDPMPNPLIKTDANITSDSTVAVHLSGPNYYSQEGFVKAGQNFGESLALNFQDRIMMSVPQNTFYGMTCGIVPCIAFGSLLILDGPKFDAEKTIELIFREKANTLITSPQNLQQLLASSNVSTIAEQITKLSLVIDQHAPSFKTASLQTEAMNRFSKLSIFNVAFADDRVAVGPLFQSANLVGKKGTDSVGEKAKHVESKLGANGTLLVRPGFNTTIKTVANEKDWIATQIVGDFSGDEGFVISKA